MTFYAAAVSVGTAAIAVASCPTNDAFQDFKVANNGAATMFLNGGTVGATDVTQGYPLGVSGTVAFRLESGETAYANVASGTVDARVLAVTGSR